MNPFSRFLRKDVKNFDLSTFVEHWDQLEFIVVATFRGESVDVPEKTWSKTRAYLFKAYPKWENALRPLWHGTLIGGKPAESDPFRWLMEHESPSAFVDNWLAMQTLPSAREALNKLMIAEGIE
jgi:hypothetical protein